MNDIKLHADTKESLVAKVKALRESTDKNLVFYGGLPCYCKVMGVIKEWYAYVSIRSKEEHATLMYQQKEYNALSYKGD